MSKFEAEIDYGRMPLSQVSNFTSLDNIILGHGDREGILINVMDMERGKNAVKVLREGTFEYWPTDGVDYLRSEPRRWERI